MLRDFERDEAANHEIKVIDKNIQVCISFLEMKTIILNAMAPASDSELTLLPPELSPTEHSDLESLTARFKEIEGYWHESVDILLQIRDRRLYREDFSNFEEFCRKALGKSRANVNRMCKTGAIAQNLATIVAKDLKEAHVRPLLLLDRKDDQIAAFKEAEAEAKLKEKPISAKFVTRAVQKILAAKAPQPVSKITGISPTDPAVLPVTAPRAADGGIIDGDDFVLADGSTIPFTDWFPGLLPEDRIRNQLKSLQAGWEVARKPEALAATVHSQKTFMGFAIVLNRLKPSELTAGLISEVPDQVNAACGALKNLVLAGIDEAASRLNNCIVTLPSFPRPDCSINVVAEEAAEAA